MTLVGPGQQILTERTVSGDLLGSEDGAVCKTDVHPVPERRTLTTAHISLQPGLLLLRKRMDAMKESDREGSLSLLWGVRKGFPEQEQWSQLHGEQELAKEGQWGRGGLEASGQRSNCLPRGHSICGGREGVWPSPASLQACGFSLSLEAPSLLIQASQLVLKK